MAFPPLSHERELVVVLPDWIASIFMRVARLLCGTRSMHSVGFGDMSVLASSCPNPAARKAWVFPLGFCAFVGFQPHWAVTFLMPSG